MPIYEFRCEQCGALFEELTSSADAARVCCQRCESQRVTRLLSAFAVASTETRRPLEVGPCGACGAAQRGTCATDD